MIIALICTAREYYCTRIVSVVIYDLLCSFMGDLRCDKFVTHIIMTTSVYDAHPNEMNNSCLFS